MTHLCHSLSQSPLIFAFNSQTSDNFGKKMDFSKVLTKCWEIFGPESPYFLCISLKDPLFLCALSLIDPLFWRNLSPKNPYIWRAWWHSYVTFIWKCPPREKKIQSFQFNLFVFISHIICYFLLKRDSLKELKQGEMEVLGNCWESVKRRS